MEDRKPSEHVRLELDMFVEDDPVAPGAQEIEQAGQPRRVLVVTADENMRTYLEDCLRRIPRVQILEAAARMPPDLIVYDAVNGDRGDWLPDGIPRLLVLDERPGAHERLNDPGSNQPRGYIVTPFDARTVVRSALELLVRIDGR